jgi:plasmid stability protein
MSVAITIRNVPEDVRNVLAARAAGTGRSLQEYLLARLVDEASRLTVDDVLALRSMSAVRPVSPQEILSALDDDRRG